MKKNIRHSFDGMPKFVVGFLGTLVFRLISPLLGLWNVSPLMATELAGSKVYGPWIGGIYGALSIAIVDIMMGKAGTWTIVTSSTYGLVGVFGAFYLKKRTASAKNFIIASVVGTLFFDLVTGVLMGPILFGGSFAIAAIGQVSFTFRHLIGNIFFASVLAPWFYHKIMSNPKWEFSQIFKFAF